MIVPQYWAEASAQRRASGRQVTVRRYGWSDTGIAEARAMAEQRAAEALARALSGGDVARREPKVPYNGAHGVPIREEIVARCGDAVVTRNSYGARCLNTPDVLFADVDFDASAGLPAIAAAFVVLALGALVVGAVAGSKLLAAGLLFVALVASAPVAASASRAWIRLQGGFAARTRRQLGAFLRSRPAWSVRVYRTPSGMRLVATHAPIDPLSDDARAFFAAVGTDPIYRRMCTQQRCYRARLTAKPWRIGIPTHMRPRPGVWPVRAERMAPRARWIEAYEAKAAAYAACTYVETSGSGAIDPRVAATVEHHDEQCRALARGVPLA